MVDAETGCEINWGIEYLPNPELPQMNLHKAVRQTSSFGDLVPEIERELEPVLS
jgi:hypothetical protein